MSRGLDVLRAAGLAGLAAGMLACGRPADHREGEPAIGPVPAVVDAATLRLPLDAYVLEVNEWDRLALAQRVLTGDCLRRFGLDLPAEDRARGTSVEFGNSRRYGITDPVLAAAHGYAPGPEPEPAPETPQRAAAPDDEVLDVLLGRDERTVNGRVVPEGGCEGEAQRRLAGEAHAPADLHLAQQLAIQSWQDSAQDSRVRAAVTAWWECMRGHGFDYASPLDPPADPRFRGGPSPEEIETAAADLDCKSRTALVAVWSTVESAYQERAIEQHAGALTPLQDGQASRLRAAEAVLAEVSPQS